MSQPIPVLGMEQWLPIPGYPGYEVSSHGRVRSYKNRNGRGGFKQKPHILALSKAKGKKYLRVAVAPEGKPPKWVFVHTLVLTAFNGPKPFPKAQACHNDGNPINNTPRNLRWDTVQSNADDRWNHGTQVRGESVAKASLTEAQVAEIKTAIPVWKRGMGRYFAQKFGITDSAVSAIKNGKTWGHV